MGLGLAGYSWVTTFNAVQYISSPNGAKLKVQQMMTAEQQQQQTTAAATVPATDAAAVPTEVIEQEQPHSLPERAVSDDDVGRVSDGSLASEVVDGSSSSAVEPVQLPRRPSLVAGASSTSVLEPVTEEEEEEGHPGQSLHPPSEVSAQQEEEQEQRRRPANLAPIQSDGRRNSNSVSWGSSDSFEVQEVTGALTVAAAGRTGSRASLGSVGASSCAPTESASVPSTPSLQPDGASDGTQTLFSSATSSGPVSAPAKTATGATSASSSVPPHHMLSSTDAAAQSAPLLHMGPPSPGPRTVPVQGLQRSGTTGANQGGNWGRKSTTPARDWNRLMSQPNWRSSAAVQDQLKSLQKQRKARESATHSRIQEQQQRRVDIQEQQKLQREV